MPLDNLLNLVDAVEISNEAYNPVAALKARVVAALNGVGGVGSAVIANGINTAQNAVQTIFLVLFSSTFNATEANAAIPFPKAGNLSNLFIRTTAAQDASGSTVATVMLNGVATLLAVTVPAGAAAGTFSNLVNTVSVAQGNNVSIRLVNNAAVNGPHIPGVSVQFT